MRKLAVAVLVLIVLAVGTVLVAPSFIDWNRIKPTLAARLEESVGRPVELNGPLSLSLLPAPVLTAQDVRVANPPGAATPDMLRVTALEVRLELLPLLSGRVVATSVVLDAPMIELQESSDGRANWDTGGIDIAVERLAVADGTIVYRRGDGVERIEKLSLKARMTNSSGAVAASGSFVLRGAAMGIDLDLARIAGDRLAGRIALTAPGNARIDLAGDAPLTGEGKIAGTLKIVADDLAAAMRPLRLGDMPWARGHRVSLDATLSGAPQRIAFGDIALSWDEQKATGAATLDLTGKPALDAKLVATRLDIDRMLASKAAPASSETTVALPAALRVTLDAAAEIVLWRGGVIRQARLQASLDDQAWRIDRLAALLPGGSDVALSGTIETASGGAVFEGAAEAESDNLRSVLEWLGVGLDGVPADRLRRTSLSAQLRWTREQLEISRLDLSIDSSRVTGGVTVALRDRVSFGARLALGRLNLDAYLGEGGASGAPVFSPAFLDRFDANLEANIGALTYRGQSALGVRVSGTLQDGNVTLHELSARDIAGAAVTLSGSVAGIGSGTPRPRLSLEAHGPTLDQTLRMIARAPAAALPALGPFSLDGGVQGEKGGYAIDTTLAVLGGQVTATGDVPGDLGAPMRLAVALRHPDAARLLGTIAPSLARGAALGALDATAKVETTATRIAVDDLSLGLGPLHVSGSLATELGGPRPRLSGELRFNELALDRLMPPRAAGAGVRVAQADDATRLASAAGTWSSERIDLSLLSLIDAELKLSGDAISWNKGRIDHPVIALSLADATLGLRRIDGEMFGGRVSAHGQISAAAVPTLDGAATFDGVDVGSMLRDTAGITGIAGRGTLALTIRAAGQSPFDLIGTLGGSGSLTLHDGDLSGVDLAAASQRLDKIERPTDLLGLDREATRGETPVSKLDAKFRIENGTVHADQVTLATAAGAGDAVVTVDLPRWTLQSRAAFRLTGHPNLPPLALVVEGALDRPRRSFDVGALQGTLAGPR